MNFLNLFKKKPKPVDEEPDFVEIPPTPDQARRRLMVLWANYGRAYIESSHSDGQSVEDEPLDELRYWVSGPLREDATESERECHADSLGSWNETQRTYAWWDMEAAVVLQWALGMQPEMPPWDMPGDWDETTDDFFEFPEPSSWRQELSLRAPDEIEQMAQSYEARYWRIRDVTKHEELDYAKKLMGRAKTLGQVDLAADGDLAMSDGSSVADVPEDRLQTATDIVMERLQALNWLCGHDPDWDSITCDTMVSWLWDENWK